ncbi:hypothetical protein [Angelakisella massiliensis]|uniref:hypothetical protein n=1 Tax=Angelakisella massiliensis TaxID=1871018 RepID=UPI0008F854B8|nr:hypothetical protein [Angelakisella massiliensis]
METGKRKTTAKGHGGRYGQSSKINLAHLLSIGMKLSLFAAAVRGKRAWGAAMSAKQPFAFKASLDLSAKKAAAVYLPPLERVEKVRHASRGYPIPPGYAAWFLTKPAAIPPVSRPSGRGSRYKNQAHVLIFMILNSGCALEEVPQQTEAAAVYLPPPFNCDMEY